MAKDKLGTNANGERLQKYLSALGIGSRRKIEEWIGQGKITVDGKVAEPGQKVTSKNSIKVDGRLVRAKNAGNSARVILYNKPEGEICTRSDPANRPTVFRNLPKLKGGRWVAVGRLDINTRGLILFTNDGNTANDLMHPGAGIEREYLCRVYGNANAEALERLKKGIRIDRQLVQFQQVRRQRGENRNTWYSVVVNEGKYREVRRMWEAVGCKLSRLSRIRYGKVMLPRGLKLGGHVELDSIQIDRLIKNRDDDKPFSPSPKQKLSRRKSSR